MLINLCTKICNNWHLIQYWWKKANNTLYSPYLPWLLNYSCFNDGVRCSPLELVKAKSWASERFLQKRVFRVHWQMSRNKGNFMPCEFISTDGAFCCHGLLFVFLKCKTIRSHDQILFQSCCNKKCNIDLVVNITVRCNIPKLTPVCVCVCVCVCLTV